MTATLNRRLMLKGSLGAAVTYLAGCAPTGSSISATPLVGFTPVERTEADGTRIAIAREYTYQTFVPWGDPIKAAGPGWQWPPSADAQAQQIGIGHDGMVFFPLSEDGKHGLLALNHEYGSNPHVLGVRAPTTPEQVRTSQHAHGVSIIEIRESNGNWSMIADSRYSRRIHANTQMRMSGPVMNHALVANLANNPITGTLNNCSSGRTPWGSYLTCEENFNFYFGSDAAYESTEQKKRYNLQSDGSFYGWYQFDARFDLASADYANESNRFGWVVEIDPMQASSIPTKRSALGRFKHEGATATEAEDGRVVVYMGDDQRFEFIYKFVSRDKWRSMRDAGISPLDEGTLYVARFNEDGSGEWLPLTIEQPQLTHRFEDQADVLVHSRLAASLVGATPMDRPEWITVAPSGELYCTLTNNTKRTETDAANPLAPNPYGQIIRWREDTSHTATSFTWDHFLVCDDVYNKEESMGSPDGLWADPEGRLLICTDGPQFEDAPNQLVVADTTTGKLSRLLVGVTGCEITGLTTTPDQRTLFVNVQHPGNGDPNVSSFPEPNDGKTIPRDCTLIVQRKDGGVIGS